MTHMPRYSIDGAIDIDLQDVPVHEAGRYLEIVSPDSFLRYVFWVLLGRFPDGEGLAHYRRHLGDGGDRRMVVADILKSKEFQGHSGWRHRMTQPLEEFINQAYRDILGRWPDQEGMNTYQRIGLGRFGRRKVLNNLRRSEEGVRCEGGRLARIEGLQQFARRRWLRLLAPWRFLAGQDGGVSARLARLELMMSCMARSGSLLRATMADDGFERIVADVSDNTGQATWREPQDNAQPRQPSRPEEVLEYREPSIAPIDDATASKLETDGWVFRVAMRDSRRSELAES
jgi:hypothetical protein